ncbi:hypothetical protein QZH41_001317 [Actinostola sp. cb2023]|nr:hypothetical protein QZH41_001317 [Actinostola sp. cb2023]
MASTEDVSTTHTSPFDREIPSGTPEDVSTTHTSPFDREILSGTPGDVSTTHTSRLDSEIPSGTPGDVSTSRTSPRNGQSPSEPQKTAFDLPSVVSGDSLGIIDPHEKYFSDEDGRRSGIRWNLTRDAVNMRGIADQFAPYKEVFGGSEYAFQQASYEGTLFRLPFRQEPSKLSDTIYSTEKIQGLQLLPLSNKTFTDFMKKSSCDAVYIDSRDHPKSLLPGAQAKFLDSDIDVDIKKKLENVARKGYTQLRDFDKDAVENHLREALPTEWIQSNGRVIWHPGKSNHPTFQWLEDLWGYFGVLDALIMAVVSNPQSMSVLSLSDMRPLRGFLSRIATLTPNESGFLKKLKLFNTHPGSGGQSRPVALSDVPLAAPVDDFPPVRLCTDMVDLRGGSSRTLAQLLGTVPMSHVELVKIMLNHALHGLYSDSDIDGLVEYTLNRLTMFHGPGVEEIKRLLTCLPFIMSGGNTRKKPGELFDPEDKNLTQMFLNEPEEFPKVGSYYAKSNVLVHLRALGLKKKTDVTASDILFSARMFVNSTTDLLSQLNSVPWVPVFDKRKPAIDEVISHLRNVIFSYEEEEKNTFISVIKAIYRYLASQDIDDVTRELDVQQIHNETKEFATLFSECGMKLKCDNNLLLNILRRIKERHELEKNHNTSCHDVKRDLQYSIDILNALKPQNGEPLESGLRENLLVPVNVEYDTTLELVPVDECTYCDREWLKQGHDVIDIDDTDDVKIKFIHRNIPTATAEVLGVPTLMSRILDADELDMGESFGQSESLLDRLKGLLEGYTDGLSVPKELIQNADDAGATEVRFLYDERTNDDAMTHLLDEGMKECQGPALWSYNDAVFTNDDFQNIVKLNAATKEEDRGKIGRFGLGFNSVYNLTDVPSFVSRESIAILDPHTTYLGKAIRDKSKPGIKFNLSTKTLRRLANQFKPYNGVFGCDLRPDGSTKSYNGTLFRFPLRTKTQAHKSGIKQLHYDDQQVKELLRMLLFGSESLLLFTQNVLTIRVYHLSNENTGAPQPIELFSISKSCVDVIHRLTREVSLSIPVQRLTPRKQDFVKQSNILRVSSDLLKVTDKGTIPPAQVLMKSALILTNPRQHPDERVFEDSWKPLQGPALCVYNNVPFTDSDIKGIQNLGEGSKGDDPNKTGLPIHINGHFALDQKARRDLWRSEKSDYRSKWNDILLRQVVAPCYVVMLEEIRQFISLVVAEDNRTYLRGDRYEAERFLSYYESFFPSLNLSVPYWKVLAIEVYRHMNSRRSRLLPVLRHICTTDLPRDEVIIEWFPPTGEEHDKVFFDNILNEQLKFLTSQKVEVISKNVHTNLRNNANAITTGLQKTRCIVVEDGKRFVDQRQIVTELMSVDEIHPYLFRVPPKLAAYSTLFEKLGATSIVTPAQYAMVLDYIRMECKDSKLDPNETTKAFKATKGLFESINKNSGDNTSDLPSLYLPGVKRNPVDPSTKLVFLRKSTEIFYNDAPHFKERLEGFERLLFVKLKKCELRVDNDDSLINQLPESIRPRKLTSFVHETLVENGQSATFSSAAQELRQILTSNEFCFGLTRLIKHASDERDMKTNDDILRNVQKSLSCIHVYSVPGLRTRLVCEGTTIPESEAEVACFEEKTEEGNQEVWNIYVEQEVGLNEFTSRVAEIINRITGHLLGEALVHLPMMLLSPIDKIRSLLDSLKIREDNTHLEAEATCFPTPGNFIHIEDHHLLVHLFTVFYPGEYVGYELDDPSLRDEDGAATYIYAIIIEEVPSGEEASPITKRYRINIGKELLVVDAVDLYKFFRRKHGSEGLEIEVFTGSETAEEQEMKPDNLDEAKRQVRKTLEEAWRLPEEKRKKIIKRLFLAWHPDKKPWK